MRIFALGAGKTFGEAAAKAAGATLCMAEERFFEDGEHKFRPTERVRGEDVYVIHCLYDDPEASVNDKLCQHLFFLGAVRDAGAARVTAIAPYLPYSRKDRRTKPRDPLTSRYVAQLFEAVGIDAMVTLDVHNVSAFENAFRRNAINLDSRRLFTDRLKDRLATAQMIVVASPDPGGVKRAQLFKETVEGATGKEAGFAFLEKRRSAERVTGDIVAGEVDAATVIVVDDMISTGGTMARAARAFRERGARDIYALAAHGLFIGAADQAICDPSIDKTLITDTAPPFRLAPEIVDRHVEIVSAAPLFGETIRRLHEDGSITELIGGAI